jgi:hypothetical protein
VANPVVRRMHLVAGRSGPRLRAAPPNRVELAVNREISGWRDIA